MVFIGNQVLRSKRGNSSPNRVAYHNPWRLKISLFMINRLDRYEGACEKAAKLIGVDEKYCICRPEFLKELQ